MKCIEEWGERNSMKINPKKCGIMKIGCSKKGEDLGDMIGEIKFVSQYKYLGVVVDSGITLGPQIKQLSKRLFGVYANFYKLITKVMGVKLKLEIWKVYVKTIVEYGCEIFSLLPKKIAKLESIYYRTLRISLGLPRTTARVKLIRHLGIMDVTAVCNVKLIRTYRKMIRKELNIPRLLQDRVDQLMLGVGLAKESVLEGLSYEEACTAAWMKSNWGNQVEELNYPDGLFQIGDEGDWDLLCTLMGQVAPRLYEKQQCEMCEVLMDQAHILNECVKHADARCQVRKELEALGIKMEEGTCLNVWLAGMQTDKVIGGLGREQKKELMVVVRKFLKKIRAT